MWRCPKCKRSFKTTNQSHTCSNIDAGQLFMGKPDALVLAFDNLLMAVADWQPNEVGVARHSIVFTSKKAWLIVKPMKSVLDIKFYVDEELTSERIVKRAPWGKKFAHHIRVTDPDEIDRELVQLIRKRFEFSLK